jgi:hypothetical protein
MDTYREIESEWIYIDDSDDSEYESGPDLFEPISPTLPAADESSDELSNEFEVIEPVDIAVSMTIEEDAIIPDIRRLFINSKPKHCNGARIQAVTMLVLGLPTETIHAFTHISISQINRLFKKAKRRGFDPEVSKIVMVEHVQDEERPGRPKCSQVVRDLIIKTVTKNSTTRQWSCDRITYEVSLTPGIAKVSARTVYQVLIDEGYGSYKRTVKPGLTIENKKARLKWCLEHSKENGWDLERWKNVIWTDETSVQLGGVRGKRRVWRKSGEAFHPHVITRRWKGFSEFMWWSAFSWDARSRGHIWEPETRQERTQATNDLAQRNAARIDSDRQQWELTTAMRRTGLRNIGGRRPIFRHDASIGAYVRAENRSGGIDWYRYETGFNPLD